MCHCHRRVALLSPSFSVQLPPPMSDLTVEQAVRKEQLMWLGLLEQPFVSHHHCARRCSVPRKYRRRDRWLLGHDRRDATETSSSWCLSIFITLLLLFFSLVSLMAGSDRDCVADMNLWEKILDLRRLRSPFKNVNCDFNIVADLLVKQGGKDARNYVKWPEPKQKF
ncbi:hypothetical protein PIB30_049867 [Stylosanthes scabra]|uniref:Uncharacterized protein n=1 Tax=Stylosanthes scabra TaxID=79078 RepID=A0ABU6TH78_9FABA|nr:hypothetical protein [Stylosanthes scabra]